MSLEGQVGRNSPNPQDYNIYDLPVFCYQDALAEHEVLDSLQHFQQSVGVSIESLVDRSSSDYFTFSSRAHCWMAYELVIAIPELVMLVTFIPTFLDSLTGWHSSWHVE
jgi:hypothetical protein